MVNVMNCVGIVKNIGIGIGKGVAKAATSETAKKLSLSAAIGAVGVLGQKGAERMIAGSEKMAKKAEVRKEERHLKERQKNIESWDGLSCEDMI